MHPQVRQIGIVVGQRDFERATPEDGEILRRRSHVGDCRIGTYPADVRSLSLQSSSLSLAAPLQADDVGDHVLTVFLINHELRHRLVLANEKHIKAGGSRRPGVGDALKAWSSPFR
jgi:hypothetical protein